METGELKAIQDDFVGVEIKLWQRTLSETQTAGNTYIYIYI